MNNKVMKYAAAGKWRRHVQAVTREIRAQGMGHRFTMFRHGQDVCGKCGKPRAEHYEAKKS